MISQRQLFLTYLAQTSPSPIGIEIERAEGIYLYDTTGKRFTDLISGISVSNTGHCHPRIVASIKKQTEKYLHLMVYGELIQSPQVQFASALAELLPPNLQSVYFVNSGSEAVEGALKLAKRFTGRSEIVALRNAYHGSSHGSMSVMGNEYFKNAFRPLLPGIKFISLNDENELKNISTRTACVIIEPVQGEAGIRISGTAYLKALRKRCNETETLLIFDEIQSGMGRTGSMFVFEQYGVIPDILLLAKGVGGGMPLGAFISSNEIMHSLSFNPVLGHITTFGGHPVSCAAALANLQVIREEELTKIVITKEKLFRALLENHPKIREIRSKGLWMALQMNNYLQVKQLIDNCIEKGVLLDWFLFCDNAVRIAPPLIITEEQIKESCKIILGCLDVLV
ncbi:MAG: aspartate aminotransferase family protein [Lentimicrobiaceae bacterium]|nr:aspartate aminotransferase family protein [Lentimicrobiaceae bacterium]